MEIRKPNPLKRAILYYPTIDIPSNNWLRQAILYWDEIGSIVPQSYDGEILSELSADVQFLMSEGEFKPIKPEDLVFNEKNHEAFNTFRNEFREIISSKTFLSFLDRKYYQNGRIEPQVKYFSKIHSNKTSDGIFYELEQRGLARRTDDWRWFEMETNTALLYMSLLAKHLAQIQYNLTAIGTSLSIYEKLNFKRVSKNGFPVVSLSLNKLLPAPLDNVPIEKILQFKRSRQQELWRFRKILLDYQNNITKSSSEEELKFITTNFRTELIIGLNDLQSAMKDARINAKVRSIRSLINFQSAPSIIALGSLVAGFAGLVPEKISIPVAIVSGSIEVGLNFLETRMDERSNMRDSAFSYVYQAQGAGIIKPF